MLNRLTIIPLFIKLTRIDNNDIWINVNNVNEILVYGGKAVIVYAGEDTRDVRESPGEIIEKLRELQK